MARQLYGFSVTIPAGTAASAGWTAPLDMPPRSVQEVRVRVPPGPRGEVGIAIGAAGTPVLPYQLGQWIVADDEVIDVPLVGAIDSGGWELFAYNTGAYDHTVQVSFLVDLTTDAGQPVAAAPLPADLLAGSTAPESGAGGVGGEPTPPALQLIQGEGG